MDNLKALEARVSTLESRVATLEHNKKLLVQQLNAIPGAAGVQVRKPVRSP